jgi:hypothetical protein
VVSDRCGEHFQPGEGCPVHKNQTDAALSEGCVYCRDAQPALCEGYCVHCGREVFPRKAEPAESPARAATGRAIDSELSYGERLAVAWLLIWRGLIIAAVGSLVTGLAGRILSSTARIPIAVAISVALLLSIFVVVPWLVRAMATKRFRGFFFVVVRKKGSDT